MHRKVWACISAQAGGMRGRKIGVARGRSVRHTLVTSQSLATHPTGSPVSTTENMQQYASLCKEPATHFPKFEKLCRTARLRFHDASKPGRRLPRGPSFIELCILIIRTSETSAPVFRNHHPGGLLHHNANLWNGVSKLPDLVSTLCTKE